MKPLKTDLSVYSQFNFEHPPVGIKYLFSQPEGIEQLEKNLGFCEMLKAAHEMRKPFYFTKENENCFGKAALGMTETDTPPFSRSGLLGEKLGVFQEARANLRLVRSNYTMPKGAINYVVYAPIDQISFEPDLLVIMAEPSQAEIILRAMTYSTGKIFEIKATTVLGCSWLYIYPHLTGKVNFTITGLSFGMKGRNVFPEGLMIISIPFTWLQTITQNLDEMTWEIEAYTMGRDTFFGLGKGHIGRFS